MVVIGSEYPIHFNSFDISSYNIKLILNQNTRIDPRDHRAIAAQQEEMKQEMIKKEVIQAIEEEKQRKLEADHKQMLKKFQKVNKEEFQQSYVVRRYMREQSIKSS